MKRRLTLSVRVGVAMMAVALTLVGCASKSGGSSTSAGSSSSTSGSSTGSGSGSASGSGSGKTITMALVTGWTDHTMNAYIFKNVLEKNGYTVDVKEFSDLAPVFAGTARGDIDVMSAWPEVTHKSYWDKYKDSLEDLDTYNHNNSLNLAVPNYVTDVQSIADLASHSSEFGGQIIGIEPGSGLTHLTETSVLPAYGLTSSMKLVTSSTTAMLSELKKETAAHKPIVATMWTPFWAVTAFGMRPLKDPKGAFGKPEGGHIIAHKGFSQEYPKVANMIAHYTLTDADYSVLENSIVNGYKNGQAEQAVDAWLAKNPAFVANLTKYLTSSTS